MDILTWDERSVLTERGFLPRPLGDYLDHGYGEVDTADRHRGMLLGLAIGDALGKPIEGLTPSTIAERHGRVNRYLCSRHPASLLPAGQVGADTQLALLTAACAATNGQFDPRDFAQRLQAWLPIARGAGDANTAATLALRNGRPWTHSGQHSAGSGAASRAAVVGLIHPDDMDMLRLSATLATMQTHADHTAVAASVATAATVAHLSRLPTGEFDPSRLLDVITQALDGLEDPSVELVHVPARSNLRERLIVALDTVGKPLQAAYAALGTGDFVLEALPAAVWAFASAPDDMVKATIIAINGGRASATVGSLVGAFAGAYNGAAGLPAPWLDHLEYVDGIAGHADALMDATGAARRRQPLFVGNPLHPASYAPFTLGGSTMHTLEHAVRSAAASDPATSVKARLLPTPADARRFAALTQTRSDWNETASNTIRAILRRRFDGSDDASAQLLSAGLADFDAIDLLFKDDPFAMGSLLAGRQAELAGH